MWQKYFVDLEYSFCNNEDWGWRFEENSNYKKEALGGNWSQEFKGLESNSKVRDLITVPLNSWDQFPPKGPSCHVRIYGDVCDLEEGAQLTILVSWSWTSSLQHYKKQISIDYIVLSLWLFCYSSLKEQRHIETFY